MEKSYLLENKVIAELDDEYTVEALYKMYEKRENDYHRLANEAHSRWVRVMDELEAEEKEEQRKTYNQSKVLLEAKYAQTAKEYELLKKYGNAFAQLYKIKDEAEKYGDFEEVHNADGSVIPPRAQIVFEEITQEYALGGVMSTADHYQMSANLDEGIEQLSLKIKLEDEENLPEFYISMLPSDGNKARVSASLVIDDEELKKFDFENPEKVKENREKIEKILKYLEDHGLDPLDFEVPHEAEGIEEFKPSRVKDEAHKYLQRKFTETLLSVQNEIKAKNEQMDRDEIHQKEINELNYQKALEKGEDFSDGVEIERQNNGGLSALMEVELPRNGGILSAQATEVNQNAINDNTLAAQSSVPNNTSASAPAATNSGPTFEKAVDSIRQFVEEGLAKKRDLSYWEKRPFFSSNKQKRNTVEFIIYPEENPRNYKDDGLRDKNGNKKLTYSVKLYIRKESDGRLGFYYKTPHNKRIDEAVVNGLAGQFKALGYTHINFPNGVSDAEKGLWRKALAEQGIVPKGIGLDRSKAEGMIKAASEKLSSEKLSLFKYRLAMQMKENNEKKGKKVDDSEQAFIDGLINSYHYEAFTGGFAEVLKNSLKKQMSKGNEDRQKGAVTKIAAYTAMRRLFDIYNETVFSSNILSSRHLSPEEIRMVQSAGLTGPIKEMKPQAMDALYSMLLERCKKEADEKIQYDIEHEPTPKRSPKLILNDAFNAAKGSCESINEELAAKGIGEIKFPSAFGPMYYPLLTQPQQQQPQQQQQSPQPQQQRSVESLSRHGSGMEL